MMSAATEEDAVSLGGRNRGELVVVTEHDRVRIKDALLREMKVHDQTQREREAALAQKCGVSPKTIERIVNGKTLGTPLLPDIYKHLKLPIDLISKPDVPMQRVSSNLRRMIELAELSPAMRAKLDEFVESSDRVLGAMERARKLIAQSQKILDESDDSPQPADASPSDRQ